MVIERIISEGIYYSTAIGQKRFCSFKECNENWLAYRKRTENINDKQISYLRWKGLIIG